MSYIPKPSADGLRRYGVLSWATPEITSHCVVAVQARGPASYHQCKRVRGHGQDGLFCPQHAREYNDLNGWGLR